MTDQNNVKLKKIEVDVPENIHTEYHARCEKEYGNKRSGVKPIAMFVRAFAKYEIDTAQIESLKITGE